ncbi:MAG: nucleotidyltransferase domain-containing protein [Candidatus Melainabacteria bacterium]|nr:nucleotidyltransferase domain-containing protein [Candidatus Melainabacteria bacterium]
MDKSKIIEYVKTIIPIFKQHVKLEYLILFGSQLTGKQHKYSDIDLAVVAKDLPKGILDNNVREALYKIHKIDWRFEPHFFRLEKWENPEYGSFIEYIKKYGEVIYSNGSK